MPQLLYLFYTGTGTDFERAGVATSKLVIIPPNDNIIFVIFMMLLYYSLGNTLESYWGHFVTMFTFSQEYYLQLLELFIVNGLIGGITGFEAFTVLTKVLKR